MSIIDDVKSRLDIADVISDYVPLQKSGRNFRALCPFHAEKDPSFYVFPERQSWHCFGGCNTGGDVFSFVMKKENIDFGEALKSLAQRSGIVLTPTSREQSQEKERLYQANEAATHYYHQMFKDSPEAGRAREYLQGRGLTQNTIEDFQLGFSPAGGQALKQHLLEAGYSEMEMVAAGLLVEREAGGTQDRFRGRLVFPIRNPQGRVAGFGARALDDSFPKYLNSPQTAVFDKSGLLYGLDRARAAIRGQDLAVIVEGYMDVIMAHQHGFTQVVATMGTALSQKQVGLLKRLTKNISLAFDADAAGETASQRAAETSLSALQDNVGSFPIPLASPGPELRMDERFIRSWGGLVGHENTLDGEIRVLILPQGKDPDEIILEDATLWQNLVSEARSMIDYVFEAVAARLDLSQPRNKIQAISELYPLIEAMKDPVRQAHYVQRLARILGVDERTLASQAAALRPTRRERAGPTPPPITQTWRSPLEEYCLALLLQHPELKPQSQELTPEHFESSENRELFLRWQQAPGLDRLQESLEPPLAEHLDSLLSKVLPPSDAKERQQALADTVLRLRERALRSSLRAREELLLSAAEAGGIDAQLSQLQEQGVKLDQELKHIFKARKQRVGPKE
jgi:DNA primase